jgi:hypothetical protein
LLDGWVLRSLRHLLLSRDSGQSFGDEVARGWPGPWTDGWPGPWIDKLMDGWPGQRVVPVAKPHEASQRGRSDGRRGSPWTSCACGTRTEDCPGHPGRAFEVCEDRPVAGPVRRRRPGAAAPEPGAEANPAGRADRIILGRARLHFHRFGCRQNGGVTADTGFPRYGVSSRGDLTRGLHLTPVFHARDRPIRSPAAGCCQTQATRPRRWSPR